MPDFFDLSRHLHRRRARHPAERPRLRRRPRPADHRGPLGEGHLPHGAHPRDCRARACSGCNLQGYGCAGLSDIGYGLAMQELERGDSGMRSFASVQGSLVDVPDPRFGIGGAEASAPARDGEGQDHRLLRPDRARLRLEPGGHAHRRDRRRRQLRAQRDEAVDHQRQHRATSPSSGPSSAASTARSAASSCRPTPRASRPALIHKKVSLRASVTSELILEDVRVQKDAILPDVRGMKGPLSCLTAARFGIAWGVIGAAAACFDCAVDYAKHRVQFAGKPIASHQLVQAKLAEMLTQITRTCSSWRSRSRASRRAKLLRPAHVSIDQAPQRARARSTSRASCRDILGGNGITLEYPVMRHMCNLETVVHLRGHARHPHADPRPGRHGHRGVRVSRPARAVHPVNVRSQRAQARRRAS